MNRGVLELRERKVISREEGAGPSVRLGKDMGLFASDLDILWVKLNVS